MALAKLPKYPNSLQLWNIFTVDSTRLANQSPFFLVLHSLTSPIPTAFKLITSFLLFCSFRLPSLIYYYTRFLVTINHFLLNVMTLSTECDDTLPIHVMTMLYQDRRCWHTSVLLVMCLSTKGEWASAQTKHFKWIYLHVHFLKRCDILNKYRTTFLPQFLKYWYFL